MIFQGIGLLLLTFLAKIAGFIRDVVLSYYYGASYIVDAYIVATTIPMVVFSFIGTGIETTLIPMMSRIDKEHGNLDRFISNIINTFSLICLLAIVIVIFFPVPVVKIFASGFSDKTMKITAAFVRFSIIGIIFSTLSYVYSGILHYKNKFIAAALSTILMDGIVLLFVVLSANYGVFLLPIGNVIALLIQAAFLRILIKYNHFFVIKNDIYLKEMLLIIIPVIIGVSVNQLNLIIDQTLASHIMIGGISYLNYANKILGVVQGVIILSFVSLLFPQMTEMERNGQNSKLIIYVKKWTIFLEFILVPCSIVFIIYAYDIVELLFERGCFSRQDSYYTGLVLFIYAIELPFYGLRELFTRVYYTRKNTKFPMKNSIIGLVVNVVLSISLSWKIGLVGLPIGTTISCLCTCLFIFVYFLKDFVINNSKGFTLSIIISFFLFAFDGAIIFIFFNQLLPSNGYWYIVKIFISLAIYCLINGFFLFKYRIIDRHEKMTI